jgi:hypothetical protein
VAPFDHFYAQITHEPTHKKFADAAGQAQEVEMNVLFVAETDAETGIGATGEVAVAASS